ncbi:MAG: hypothetical protein ABIR46_02425 [Candidatus Saccharimonadales bacterium]
MSEAMHSESHSKPTPDVARASHHEHEITDFSQVGPEIAVSYLFSELRQPMYSKQRGQDLAASIAKLSSVESKKDTISHEGRLAELIRTPLDDELWDKKAKDDEIFKLIEEILRDRQIRGLTDQRSALLRLYNLRGSFEGVETAADEQWKDVIERLFS